MHPTMHNLQPISAEGQTDVTSMAHNLKYVEVIPIGLSTASIRRQNPAQKIELDLAFVEARHALLQC